MKEHANKREEWVMRRRGGGGSDLSKAKVSQLDKALQVYEDVLRLEVPVHDVVVVEVL